MSTVKLSNNIQLKPNLNEHIKNMTGGVDGGVLDLIRWGVEKKNTVLDNARFFSAAL